MSKAFIVQGDPTTTGGVVMSASAFGMEDNGRTFALDQDEATCGICEGTFPINGTATQRCYDGRPGVIEGDHILCPCGQNRVMAGPNPGCFYQDDSDANSVTTKQAANAISASSVVYDEQFQLTDGDGNLLTNTYYSIKLPSGELCHGITDSQGRTTRYTTNGTQTLCLYLGHRDSV